MRLTTIILSKSVYIRNTTQTPFIKTHTTSKQKACCMNIFLCFQHQYGITKEKSLSVHCPLSSALSYGSLSLSEDDDELLNWR